MTARVVKLPTAAKSYIRVKRWGMIWRVDLVTPGPSGPTASTLGWSPDFDAVVQFATETGQKMQRPVRLPRGSA